MKIRRIWSLMLVLLLTLGCTLAGAEEDLQAQLDAANARIAELQEQVDTYYPYYLAQIVATYGEDGIVWLEDVQEIYDTVSAQYQSMGLNLETYGMADSVKRDIVDTSVENGVLMAKAEELGLDQLDEATVADIEAQAKSSLDSAIDNYINYYYADQEVTDEMRAEGEAYFADNGVTLETQIDSLTRSKILEAVRDYVIADVTVGEEDVQAAYEELVAANRESYTNNDATYNSDRNAGVAIAWNPEGYRAVKHVLIQFSDEQAARYNDLQDQLDSLQSEREAIANPEEEASADAEESDSEASTTPEEEGTAEAEENEETEEKPKRSLAEVDADIAACGMEVEALYTELMPEAEEVIRAFEAGTPFDELIEKYNDDPGMKTEPTASQGYAVSSESTTWDPAFTEGAMAIQSVGGISAPVYGSNGIHIIYYMSDITPGEVGLEAIRESVEEDALEEKRDQVYEEQLAAWVEEAGVVYHYENFGIAEEEEAAADEEGAETEAENGTGGADVEDSSGEAPEEGGPEESADDNSEDADVEEDTGDASEEADAGENAEETSGEADAGAAESEAAADEAEADAE